MRLVADANVLLSALIGGRAKAVLTHPDVEAVFTTRMTLAEVQDYVVGLAAKRRLPLDRILLTLAALPVTVVERAQYAAKLLDEAARAVGHRPSSRCSEPPIGALFPSPFLVRSLVLP